MTDTHTPNKYDRLTGLYQKSTLGHYEIISGILTGMRFKTRYAMTHYADMRGVFLKDSSKTRLPIK